MIAGIFIILLWMVLVPFGIGLLVTTWLSDRTNILLKSYLFGIAVYLALFQVIIVSNMLTVNNFFKVCTVFSYATVFLAILGIVIFGYRKFGKKAGNVISGIETSIENREALPKSKRMEAIVLWVFFGAILVFQLIQSLRLTYPDGDDAYYVGVATYGADVPEMYSRIPYTGATTEFDTRHCLAPFPYVISFLSRMSHIESSVIAHSILPVFFILFAYGIYYLIAGQICKEKREISLFMLLTSILLMFGNYSVYSMETFLLTRTRQGKASLGSFALPLGFYLLLLLAKQMEQKRRDRVLIYVLLGCVGLVAALFTTMGNFIYPSMIALGSLCICFSKKEWKKLIPLAFTCIPSVCMAALYFIIR